ncbi:Ribokinase-like protein [Aspergillus leporis]|uniref:Ribokinase n=1 Tax=Aspergillus leporis TaxID=41062 RepID=A0A5N5XKL8_9EURO|nr:Ribokinase-like protein [Aspergillus leporis]
MASKPQICVIGSLNIDFVTYTRRCPGPGETLTGSSLCINAGGKGANQAIACARAGFTTEAQQDVVVSMIGAVGADDPYYPALMRPTLEKAGINTAGIEQKASSQTGSATIIVEEGENGENRIVVIPGANHDGMNDTDKILTTIQTQCPSPSPQVVVLQGEIPRSTVISLLQHFNDCRNPTHIVLNVAPVYPDGLPVAALAGTAVLIMNETEAMQMAESISGVPVTSQSESDLRPEQLAPLFHKKANISIVVITLGSKGAFYSTATGCNGFVRGLRVNNVVDTTAAGDTFVGYLSTAFAKYVATGASLEGFDPLIGLAVQEANRAAALCVQRRGAIESIPLAYEIIESQ